jgi:hypothetical protein
MFKACRALAPRTLRDVGRPQGKVPRCNHAADALQEPEVARRYIRHAQVIDDNAAVGLA